MRILLVEDEPSGARFIAKGLREAKHAVDVATDGIAASRQCQENDYDAVILDVMLPGKDGLTVCRDLRAAGSDVPVLMLTARDAVEARVQGLDAGADDYLTKPFSPQELSLRVGALLRRLGSPAVSAGSTLSAGPITIDRSAHRATLHGHELNLTATEYKLLLTLVERRGRVQSRPQLLEIVWEAQPDIQTRTVDMHVQRLRSKLGDAGRFIETVRGFGYRFKGGERGARSK